MCAKCILLMYVSVNSYDRQKLKVSVWSSYGFGYFKLKIFFLYNLQKYKMSKIKKKKKRKKAHCYTNKSLHKIVKQFSTFTFNHHLKYILHGNVI